jgi:hypothetical protein
MESDMFDFPHPLGPTTAAMPSPGNFSSVRSQKDLKPRICSFFNLSNFLLLQEWPMFARLWLTGAIFCFRATGWSSETRVSANVSSE